MQVKFGLGERVNYRRCVWLLLFLRSFYWDGNCGRPALIHADIQ